MSGAWLRGDAIRVGTDPDDGTWLDARAEQWASARYERATYEATGGVVELAVRLSTEALEPTREQIEAPDGTVYLADPAHGRVWVRGLCDEALAPLRVGCALRAPWGLAWVGACAGSRGGRLLVADAGAHCVHVIDPASGALLHVLGARDAWGDPASGIEGGAMTEPVDVAVAPSGAIAVADRQGARVHVFRASMTYVVSFEPRPDDAPGTFVAAPLAIAWDGDGTLLVLDARWPRVMRFVIDDGVTGRVARAGELDLRAVDHPRFRGLRAALSFEPEGSVVLGPLDSREAQTAWHALELWADVPLGTSIVVQSWASDDAAGASSAMWAPEDGLAVPIEADGVVDRIDGRGRTRAERLVRAHPLATDPLGLPVHSDRGRFLFVKISLRGPADGPGGAATDTPRVHALRATFPRRSHVELLPAVLRRREHDDLPGATFLERYMSLFASVLRRVEQRYEELPALINPRVASGEWLSWLASLVALSFDPSWSEAKRRALLAEAIELYRRRGTPWAIARYVEIYTGRAPILMEDFRAPRPRVGVLGDARLGSMMLGSWSSGSPSSIAESGAAFNVMIDDAGLAPGPHRFTVFVHADDVGDRELREPVVHRILARERPLHTDYRLVWVLPLASVGERAIVGIDLVLGEGDDHVALGAPDPRDPMERPGSVLGRTTRLGPSRARAATGPDPALDDAFAALLTVD